MNNFHMFKTSLNAWIDIILEGNARIEYMVVALIIKSSFFYPLFFLYFSLLIYYLGRIIRNNY